MKQCPRCKKFARDEANVCPHCGYRFVNKPTKQTGKKNQWAVIIYSIFAMLMIISPLFLSYFVSSFDTPARSSTKRVPDEQVELGELGKVDIQKEEIYYIFSDLKTFEEKIDVGTTYTKEIKSFEKQMSNILDKYENTKIEKGYDIYVTDQNNIYFFLEYQITIDGNTMTIYQDYDISGETNDAEITWKVEGYQNFEEMKIAEESHTAFIQLVSLVNGEDQLFAYNKATDSFNDLESSFEERQETLGNYGMGIKEKADDDSCSIRITKRNELYNVTIKYETKNNR